MLPLTHAKGSLWGVVGLGKAGRAMVEALHFGGAKVIAWDDKAEARQELGDIASITAPEAMPWQQMDGLVMSPGIAIHGAKAHPAARLAHQHGVAVVGDAEMLYRERPEATYIGITGTNGKSTTTELVGHMLRTAGKRVAVGGNLGIPAVALDPDADIYVLEMSSYQLELVDQLHFHAAVHLNLSIDHQERHGSMEGYMAAKARIFRHMGAGDLAVIGVDDHWSRAEWARQAALAEVAGYQRLAVGCRELLGQIPEASEAVVYEGGYVSGSFGDVALAKAASLQGPHNAQNVAAALAIAHHLGLSVEQMQRAVESYQGLPHRMEIVTQHHGVTYVNDSKATNADAAHQALKSFERIFWIAGGLAKEGDLLDMALVKQHVVKAYLVGKAEDWLAECCEGVVPYARAGTLEHAVAMAAADAGKAGGGVVLLSPACASMDQWKNFEERGQAFRDYVMQRVAGEAPHAAA